MKRIIRIITLSLTTLFICSGCHFNVHVHTGGEPVEENRVEPTCTEDGSYESVIYCVDDGEEMSRETVVLPALGHDLIEHVGKEATYEEEGYLPYVTCSRCDYTTYQITPRKEVDLKPRDYSLDIPVINITVNGAHIPDRSDPEYHNYCPAVLNYEEGDTSVLDESGKVRIRGTSSRWFKKKGYKIKFSSKVSIGGLPASKKFNLLASYMDPTLLRDYLAMQISYDMNTLSGRYSPTIRPVKVYLDEVYKGIYYLIDDIGTSVDKINLLPSEDENKTSFLLEMDTLAHKEGEEGVNYFVLGTTDVFDYDGDGYTDLEYKLDTPETVSETQFQFIENYIKSCREALVNKDLETFSSLVDVKAFIDYFMLAEIFRNTDLAGRSVYLYLPDVNGKLIYGPSWDFDYSCSRPYQLGPNQDYTLENATDRFSHFDFWELFLEIDGVDELISSRYTYYLKPIIEYELQEEERYYNFYKEMIKANADIWYTEIEDIPDLLVKNLEWTFEYFSLRCAFYDALYLIEE